MTSTRTRGVKQHPVHPGRIRRALRLVGWNVLFLVAGLALIGVVGEMYRNPEPGRSLRDGFARELSTDYRNPVIAEAMATLGYGRRIGNGVLRAREALRRNGNPEARFRFDRSFVLARIPRKR